MSQRASIILSGLIWFLVGMGLLTLGINLLVDGSKTDTFLAQKYPLLETLGPLFGSLENGIVVLMVLALFVGYAKGRAVLGKTALKTVTRFRTMQEPIPFTKIYTPRYYILLGAMILLGMSMRFFGLAGDIRGFIDVAVGSALINGAMVYFREALAHPQSA